MFPIRVKTVQESDLRMLGSLARNIQRVLPVTQADIDAAAALGKGWVVWKVFEVSDPLDNMRGGTQLIIRQNSIQLGQNVRRVIFVSGPGGQTVVIRGTDYIVLPDAIAHSLSYVKAFGGTEQRNLPDGYIERQFIYMMDGSYLLTDIVPSSDMRIEMDFQTTSILNCRYLGARNSAVAGNGLQLGVESSNFVVDGFQERYQTGQTPTANTRYKFVYNDGAFSMYQGGTLISSHTFTPDQTTTAKMVINAINTAGTISGNTAGIYLYSFKVWNAQGELVADYVPAVQKGTVPVVGFYDTVSGTFKTATAGTFAAGGEAVPTPDAPMDIISNNGAIKFGQYGKNLNVGELDHQGYTSTGGTSTSTTFCGTLWQIPVNEGEKYTISYGNFPDGISGVFISTWKTDGTWNARQAVAINAPYTYTVPAGIGKVNFTLYKTGGVTIADNSWVQVEAGETATEYEPAHFGLHTDGPIETINVHTKNISNYDKTLVVTGSGQGIVVPGEDVSFVPSGTTFKENTRYTISMDVSGDDVTTTGPGSLLIFYVFYSDGTNSTFGITEAVAEAGGRASWTTVSGKTVTDIRRWIKAARWTSGTITVSKMQIEEGTTATDYEPYYNGGTATAEMLLKVDDYQDEQEILSGVVTRKVGVKVLDGTENVGTLNATFTIAIADRVTSKTPLVCSHFEYSTKTSSQVENLKVISFSSTNIGFRYDACADTTAFKTWLANQYAAGTPVIVLYPLATPTTESVAAQTLQVTDGDNVLEITQASLTGLELEVEYQAAVSLTIQEVQDANLDNNVTVTIQ